MRAKEIRGRSLEELEQLAKGLREELFTFRFQNHTNRLDDSSKLGKTKRDLARVLSVLREKKAS